MSSPYDSQVLAEHIRQNIYWLYSNFITQEQINTMPNLKCAIITNNQNVESVELLENLEVLSSNFVTQEGIENNEYLSELYCGYNKRIVDLNNLSHLAILCSNYISEESIKDLQLFNLYCYKNKWIKDLCFMKRLNIVANRYIDEENVPNHTKILRNVKKKEMPDTINSFYVVGFLCENTDCVLLATRPELINFENDVCAFVDKLGKFILLHCNDIDESEIEMLDIDIYEVVTKFCSKGVCSSNTCQCKIKKEKL